MRARFRALLPSLLDTDTPAHAVHLIREWLAAHGRYRVEWLDGEDSPETGVLRVLAPDGAPANDAVALHVHSAWEGWLAVRRRLLRLEDRLLARTDELDLLQQIGRGAADARTLDGLFESVATALHARWELDAVVFAVDLPRERPTLRLFLARELPDGEIGRLAGDEATGPGKSAAHLTVVPLDGYEAQPARRPASRPEEAMRVDLHRGGDRIGTFGALASGALTTSQRRVLFSVANQVSMQVDRILTVEEAEHGRFEAILDSMPQAVILTDPELRVVRGNRSAQALLRSVDQEAGRPLRLPGDLDLQDLATRVLEGRSRAVSAETRAEGFTWIVSASALTGNESRPSGLVVVVTDVTESRRLQQQLAQSEKMSSLGQMLSGVAHELNNPLASILGYAQLIQASSSDDKLNERLGILYEQATRCQRIVGNLLSFARRREPETRPISLNEIVRSVHSLMEYQLRVDGIELIAELDPGVPAGLGDQHQMQQVLVNLLTNAQHAIAGGKGNWVRVSTRPQGADHVLLEVEDDGPGIPSEVRSKIFDPFFTTKEPGKGTGLGLSLVYGIVKAHDGEIEVDSPPGFGARFRISLPAARSEHAELSRAEPVAEPESRAEPLRILVVEDEESLSQLMCEALSEDGHDVRPVADGRRALEMLAESEFDLVLSDVKMPVMGGRRLYEEIRRRRPDLSSRFVLTTGDTVDSDAESFARAGGIRLLHKPFSLDDLKHHVRSTLRREDH